MNPFSYPPAAVAKFLAALSAFVMAVGNASEGGFTRIEIYGLVAAFIIGPVAVFLIPNQQVPPMDDEGLS